MTGLLDLTASLPPLGRFAFILVLVAAAPFGARRCRLPDRVGCILVGVTVGPHLLGVVPRHEEIADVLADLGKLLLMFAVGLEIDLRQFTAQRNLAVALPATWHFAARRRRRATAPRPTGAP